MGITEQQINDLMSEAKKSLQIGALKTQSLGGSLRDQLTASVGSLQDTLNALLQKGGVVTDQQYNSLDEQTRLLKLKTLEAESQYTSQRFAMYVGISVAVIGLIWYFSKD